MANKFGELDREHERQEQASKPAPAFKDQVRTLGGDWFQVPPKTREWLATFQDEVEGNEDEKKRRVHGLIARGELHILAGEGGAGKGRFALQLALCLAGAPNGKPFSSRLALNAHPLGKGEKILFLVGEDDAHELHARTFGAAKVEGFNPEHMRTAPSRVLWRSFRGDPWRLVAQSKDNGVEATADFRDLRAYLEENGPWAMIVIDPLSRFLPIEENDNPAMHQAAAEIENLCKVPGNPAVVVVAHTRKPADKGGRVMDLSQHDVRGASAVVNAARLVIMLAPGAEYVTVNGKGEVVETEAANARTIREHSVRVAIVKDNVGAKGRPFTLNFHLDGGLRAETESERTERRKKQWGHGLPPKPVKAKPESKAKGGAPTSDDDGGFQS